MKTKKILLSLLGLGVAAGLNAQTWDGLGADDLWTTSLNWGGTAPVANDSLTFDGTTQTTNTNDFAAGTQFNGITLMVNSGPWTLNGNAINLAGDITVSANSTNRGLGTNILNMDLALQNATTTITTRSNDNITLNGLISGTTDIRKAAAGTLRFTNNANTWDGNLQIDAGGTVAVTSIADAAAASAAGAGSTISFGHVTQSAPAILQIDASSAQSTDRQILIGDNTAGATRNHHARIENIGTGTVSFTNATFNIAQGTANATRTLTLAGNNTGANTISGVIQNNSASGTVTLVKGGTGTWVLEGINTYTGGTTINAGTLVVGNHANNLGTQALTLNGGTLQVTTAGNLNPVATRAEAGRGLVIGANGGTLNISDAAGNLQVTGVMSGAGNLNVTGIGRFTPSNTGNTAFTGNINVSGGATVSVSTAGTAAEGSLARLGSGANFNMDNGTLNFSGSRGEAQNTHTRNTVLGAGGGTFQLGNAADQNPTITWNGDISGTGDLTVSNAGGTTSNFILGGAVTHTGNTTITNGSTLTLADGASMTFVIGADGVNNGLLGDGTVNLDGEFIFDLTGAAAVGSWTLVAGTLTENFGGTFSVKDFTNNGGVWTFGDYTFDESTGVLTAVPEPATYALIGGLLALGAVLIRRRMK